MTSTRLVAWDAGQMGEPPPEAEVAIRAVSDALELALARVGAADVTHKDGRDVVTATDMRIEDQVRGMLHDALGSAVVGEERGGDAASAGTYWLLDPICGTRNYASGIPLYCINLALIRDRVPALSAVGDPSTGEVLVAQAGAGAWALRADAGARRLRASASSQTLVIEDSHADGPQREHAAQFAAAAIRANRWDLRSLSSTLSLAYLAAGRVSGYALFWTSPVHAAAGSLLAAEAGAVVTDLHGRPWTIGSGSLLAAADAQLHAQLLKLVDAAGRAAGGAEAST
ncbi:MAG: inositol monophosphatase family protein [Streptosporangiaceae bacterium]